MRLKGSPRFTTISDSDENSLFRGQGIGKFALWGKQNVTVPPKAGLWLQLAGLKWGPAPGQDANTTTVPRGNRDAYMIMPKGINGRETYEEIMKVRPGQKAIIASGFSMPEDVKIAQRLGAGKYIKKPYTLKEIGLAVKEELAK